MTKIEETRNWYSQQLREKVFLFHGEENQMTEENCYHKINWLYQMEAKEKLAPHHQAKLERMHYFGPIKWPLERIKERALLAQ